MHLAEIHCHLSAIIGTISLARYLLGEGQQGWVLRALFGSEYPALGSARGRHLQSIVRSAMRAAALATFLLVAFGLVSGLGIGDSATYAQSNPPPVSFTQRSSATGDLVVSGPTEQTASLVLDIDGDGRNDIVLGGRGRAPALVWYKRTAGGWERHLIEGNQLAIEAGGAFYDIDGDGDLDIVMGGDYTSNQVWWWENPYPNYAPTTAWRRYTIKNSGANQHHDQVFADLDGDGRAELYFWNQRAQQLLRARIPANPRSNTAWPTSVIYTAPSRSAEGLEAADVDGDGRMDLLGAGIWFRNTGGGNLDPQVITGNLRLGRVAAGQLVPGGRLEIVFAPGEAVDRAYWYSWENGRWVERDLFGFTVERTHSLAIGDVNGDGHQDVFLAEMRLSGGNSDAKSWLLLGDSTGRFTRTEVSTGLDNHESRVADLDGDGDLDILTKPYNHNTPRLDIFLNNRLCAQGSLNNWERRVIDSARPQRAIFIRSADLDGDGYPDLATGANWYRNPGAGGGTWERRSFGSPLNQVAVLYDFDGDGDIDVLGTQGVGSASNSNFAWARNDGRGNFTVLRNVEPGQGDFLQGAVAARFSSNRPIEVALSWHQANRGVQMLTVPSDPSSGTWTWRRISVTSQDEDLSTADIDRDGDLDLLLGTKWLRNDGSSWSAQTLNSASGMPDRNRLGDIDGDGRLDAVVGYEAINTVGKLAWYRQGSSATGSWEERTIGSNVYGPMSLDVADMDGDGDLDVVVGEHRPGSPSQARLLVFENVDGRGTSWRQWQAGIGDEHHDGALLVDVDRDGDLDIVSIGWNHSRVLLYENRGGSCGGSSASPTAQPTATRTPTPSQTATATRTATANPIAPTATSTTTPPTPSPAPTDGVAPDAGTVPVEGLGLWLSADEGVSTTNGRISAWADQSPNGRSATQATSGARPALLTNRINGLPVARFDGVDDFMRFSYPINGLRGMTIIMVSANNTATSTSNDARRAAIFWNETGYWGATQLSPYQDAVQARFGTGQSGNNMVFTRRDSIRGAYTLTAARHDGGTDMLFVDGKAVLTETGKLNTIARTQDTGQLGRGYNDNTYFSGDIAEVLVYSRALSDQELRTVHSYLLAKYFPGRPPLPPADAGTAPTETSGEEPPVATPTETPSPEPSVEPPTATETPSPEPSVEPPTATETPSPEPSVEPPTATETPSAARQSSVESHTASA
jgi:hypothetical protein